MEPESSPSENQENVTDTANPDPSPADSGIATKTPNTPTTDQPKDPSEKPARKISPKTIILLLILLLIIITATVIIYMYLQPSNVTTPPETSQTQTESFTFKARVEYLTGTAYKLIDERKVEILEGDILDEGDKIQTDKDSRLVLSLDDGSVIRIDSGSELELDQLSSAVTSLTNKQGVVFARVNKDESHVFQIMAGDLTIEASGTAYSVENTNEIKVRVFESEVNVKTQNQEETKLTVNQEWNSTGKQVLAMNMNTVKANEFYNWSLSEEKLAQEQGTAPTSAPKPTTVVVKEKQETQTGNYIKLSGTYSSAAGGIKLQWKAVGLDTSQGFKVIKNLSGNPVYPGDEAQLVGKDTAYYFWQINDGKTWRFRVCQYQDGKCSVYSNEIIVTAGGSSSGGEQGSISSISLSAEKISDSSAKLTFSVEGNAPKGFKVAWSKSTNPTYPPRDGDWWTYLSDSGTRSTEIGGLESGSTYYFKVCEYLGGPCGTYSNQATLVF